MARDRAVSRLRPRGLPPEPLKPTTFFSFGSHNMQKASPPMPLATGSRKPSAALMAMAASMAEPPRLRVSIPTRLATGCAVAAAPLAPQTVERPMNFGPVTRSPMPTSA